MLSSLSAAEITTAVAYFRTAFEVCRQNSARSRKLVLTHPGTKKGPFELELDVHGQGERAVIPVAGAGLSVKCPRTSRNTVSCNGSIVPIEQTFL